MYLLSRGAFVHNMKRNIYRRIVVERGGAPAAAAAKPQFGAGDAPKPLARGCGWSWRRGRRGLAARRAAARTPPAAATRRPAPPPGTTTTRSSMAECASSGADADGVLRRCSGRRRCGRCGRRGRRGGHGRCGGRRRRGRPHPPARPAYRGRGGTHTANQVLPQQVLYDGGPDPDRSERVHGRVQRASRLTAARAHRPELARLVHDAVRHQADTGYPQVQGF
ncbi:uncharacterized protein LOC119189427 [Manduca sexta]|uniref:uncharacterized protein LOC119189427 n=1 Tax=Manduca sexta TaxID=7130 RepID=UPI00188FF7EB|nr:uncharacterized protein LOC119189427 [Manduca sexta]